MSIGGGIKRGNVGGQEAVHEREKNDESNDAEGGKGKKNNRMYRWQLLGYFVVGTFPV